MGTLGRRLPVHTRRLSPPLPPTQTGRKRKEVNYNEEKIVASFESDDEGGGGAAAAKKGRSSFLTPKVLQGTKPLPSRKPDGTYHFADHPEFKPNLSPKEVRACVHVYRG